MAKQYTIHQQLVPATVQSTALYQADGILSLESMARQVAADR